MPAVISVSQCIFHLIRFQQRCYSFPFSTEFKHGKMFVVAFSVFGSVICEIAVSFFSEISISVDVNIHMYLERRSCVRILHSVLSNVDKMLRIPKSNK